ncbi:MAG: amidohydrolase family protein [bacterium]
MTLLIRDVQIIDGEGRPPFKGDVYVHNDKISSVGKFHFKSAESVIEGNGDYLTPGFIDAYAASDHHLDLLTNPAQADFVKQGVTTIIGGHDGVSLAPLFYGSLELFRRWTDADQININWHTCSEFFSTLEHLQLGVSFAMLAGHASIKSELTHMVERDLNENELRVFQKLIRGALSDGVLGCSSGLSHIHGRYAPPDEIKMLVQECADEKKVYSVHLRDQRYQLVNSVSETIALAAETEARTMISWFQPLVGFEAEYEEALEYLRKSTDLHRFRFAIFPHVYSLRSIYTLLPPWAQDKSTRAMLEKLQRPNTLARLEQAFTDIDPEHIQVASAQKNDFLVGKTIADIAETHKLSPQRALLKLMIMTNLRATVFYKDINAKTLQKVLCDPQALIVSNSHSPIVSEVYKHERHVNTFPKFLHLMVSEAHMPIEEAIRKITAIPAEFFRLEDRGVIRKDKRADLVLLDKNDLHVKKAFVGGTTNQGMIIRQK